MFEAAWGPDGAVHTRIPEVLSTSGLAERYLQLADRIGPGYSEKVAALIWNRT